MISGSLSCPIKQCGRKFQNQQTMLQHVRRRHPGQYSSIKMDLTKSIIQKQHAQQQQISKLPRLAKIMSKQKKGLQNPIRSDSKNKKTDGMSANLSNIIQQSRQITSGTIKGPISTRRPSLSKKVSAPNLKQIKIDKLPPIQKDLKKMVETGYIEKKNSITSDSNEQNQQMYTTMPDFKTRAQALIRSKSKGKRKIQQNLNEQKQKLKQKQKQSYPIKSITFNNTMTTLTVGQKNTQQPSVLDKKKSLYRPTKKLQRKPSEKSTTLPISIMTQQKEKQKQKYKQKQGIDYNQKIVHIKSWPQPIFTCPPMSKIQLLFLNNCNLSNIVLNSLQSLIELSATGNKLQDMQFLNYPKNTNIKVLHLDHNQISQLYTPPKLKILTASFNMIKVENIEDVCAAVKRSPELEEIDLSFNGVRKAENYKLRLLGVMPRVKKIDGLVVTKIDIQMMKQYKILQSKQKGLIPINSPGYDRPGTAVSQYYLEQQHQPSQLLIQPHTQTPQPQKTIQQLQKQQKKYQKMLAQTEQQLKVIKKENQIIETELQTLTTEVKDMEVNWDSASLFYKLQKQCEFLELLNVMQYADEEQLALMIRNKKIDLGIPTQ